MKSLSLLLLCILLCASTFVHAVNINTPISIKTDPDMDYPETIVTSPNPEFEQLEEMALGLFSFCDRYNRDGTEKNTKNVAFFNETLTLLKQKSDNLQWRQDIDAILLGKEMNEKYTNAVKKPVVLIPGITASGLVAKFDIASNWFKIWANMWDIVCQDSLFKNFEPSFDPNTKKFKNAEGINILPHDFGGVEGVDYIDQTFKLFTNVFGKMINYFTGLGYKSHQIRGAPYDWRLPIQSLFDNGWMSKFQQLIEDTYTNNGNQRVVLISHSMGGLVTTAFLNTMTEAWRDQYIDTFVPMSAPWSGAPKSIENVVSGESMGWGIIPKWRLRNFARTSGGVIQLIPNDYVYDQNKIVVVGPGNERFSVSNITTLFSRVDPIAGAIHEFVKHPAIRTPENKPLVNTLCIYTTGVDTVSAFDYSMGYDRSPRQYMNAKKGDGTVPFESLASCNSWSSSDKHRLVKKEFSGVEHAAILKEAKVFEYIVKNVLKQ
ncbi:hypothetical protein CYY_009571 [Polysphondylium violaceum]|uniref:Lecithin:cholesterol acyltransferase family protein n=1 Tax=Polysphondylium violaceum TaxID=133409 RepID=A0A8J4V0E1_9MYCE|nr:hypothetical protein CYY_009571 [Polysphondylium violaceum]